MAQAQEAELLYKIRVEASQAIKDMQAASGQLKDFQREAANSTSKMSGMQRGVQNASYQLQDFVVQTTMGTDALRALGQQLPQLLGSFGAAGAVLGVVASLLPVVIELFKGMSKEAMTFEESIKGADASLKLLKESFNFADRSTLDPLIESYNKADVATKALILSNMELNIAISKVAEIDLSKTLGASIEQAIKQIGFFKGLWIDLQDTLSNSYLMTGKNQSLFKAPDDSLKTGFGIDQAQLDTIKNAQKELNDGKIKATEFLDVVTKIYTATARPTGDFTKWTQGLQEAVNKTKELEQARKQYEEAKNRIGNGDTSTTKSIDAARKEADKALKEQQKENSMAYEKVIADIQKQSDAMQRLSEAQDREANALRALSDPMAAYNIALEKANVLLEANKISTEEYEKAMYRAETTLANSNKLVNSFGDSLTNAFTGAMLAGKSFGDTMQGLAIDIQGTIVKIMIIEPLLRSMKLAMVNSGFFGTDYNVSTPGFVGPPVPSANGNVFSGGIGSGSSNVIPFAKGGILSSPSYFPMAGGKTGLAGEAGSEAIMPLKRDAQGKLGVSGSMGGSNTQVNIYNETGGQVETQERKNGDGMTVIDVLIKKAVSEGIANGQFDKPMAAAYGMRRTGTR